ncbi:MAG: GAF domain-containing sensor histidine kinase [Ferrimicrobium sp.]
MTGRTRELELYRALAQLVSEGLSVHELAGLAAALVVEAVDATVCFVYHVDHRLQRLTLIGATPPYDAFRDSIQLGLGDGIAGWVAQTGVVAIVPNKWEDPRYRYIPELGGEHYQALVSVPLSRPEAGVVGVLNVHWEYTPDSLGEDAELLVTVAHFLAGAFERTFLIEGLSRHEAELQDFASRLLRAEEVERRRIQLDLHDGVVQQLHGAYYHLEAALSSEALDEETRRELDRSAQIVIESVVELRRIIEGSHWQVLDDLGLVDALESLARSIDDLSVSVSMSIDFSPVIGPDRALGVLRICQEALNNVRKHSGVHLCEMRVTILSGELVIGIRDRGAGFDRSSPNFVGGIGLDGMQERARMIQGRVEVFSRVEEGTLVRIAVPLEE